MMELEDEADPAIPERGESVAPERTVGDAVELDAPCRREVKGAEAVEARALPHPARSRDGDELPPRHGEVEPREDHDAPPILAGVPLGQPDRFEDGGHS